MSAAAINVVANLAWIVPGRVGGSEEYSVRLLDAVIDLAPADIDLRIVGSADLRDAHPSLARVQFDVVGGPTGIRPYRVAAESTVVHRLSRGADVVHHFGGRVPARHHRMNIVTIHDLQPLHLPDNFSVLKRRYLAWVLPRSARAAALVVTPSEWVASSVVEAFGLSPSRVRAVSSTYDPETSLDSAAADTLPPGPLILYPAVTHPHKSHALLLAGFAELRRSRPDVSLVLTGGEGRADPDVRRRIATADGVRHLGRVPAQSLRALYVRADVVAFPSVYEGFGLPVIEALRANTPVVVADTPALREVGGEAARVVADSTPEAWAGALAAALDSGAISGVDDIVAHYAPAAAAQRLIDAWRSVAKPGA